MVSDTAGRRRLAEDRDQALRDLLAVDEQERVGEIPAAAAEALRRRYEAAAAHALSALAEPDQPTRPTPSSRRHPSRVRRAAYLATALAAVLAAVVVLPRYLAPRPAGGFVTGNLPTPAASSPAPNAAPGRSSAPAGTSAALAALQAAVRARPEDAAARLALANVETAGGRYADAATQYGWLLQRDPNNAEVLAHSGWLLLQTGQPQQAYSAVTRALRLDPGSVHGLWFLANIELSGLADPTAALATLRQLQDQDMPASLRAQVQALTAAATRQAGGR